MGWVLEFATEVISAVVEVRKRSVEEEGNGGFQ
jgi:hypothetical protein